MHGVSREHLRHAGSELLGGRDVEELVGPVRVGLRPRSQSGSKIGDLLGIRMYLVGTGKTALLHEASTNLRRRCESIGSGL
jgi:hypothetical protein